MPARADPARLSAGAAASAPASASTRTSWPPRSRRRLAAGDSADAVLELLEGPARAPDACPARGVVDARVPVRVLNLAWHRLGWPPVERLAGTDRRRALAASAADAGARRARRWSRSTTSTSSIIPSGPRAEIRRDYAALAAAPRPARRRASSSSRDYTAGEVDGAARRAAERIVVCPPGAPAWPRRAAAAAPAGRSSSSARSSRARTSRRCCGAYARLRAAAAGRAAAGAGRARTPDRGSRDLGHDRRPPLVAARPAPRLRRPTSERQRALRARRRCWCCRRSTKASACRRSKR